MTRIQDVFDELCRIAPLELQMDFDNAGFQVGRRDREVHRVLLALDATDEVLREAMDLGAELIVTHHPLLFTPLRSISDTEPVQRRRNTCRTISQNQDIRFKVIHLSLQKDYAIVSLTRAHPSSGIWAPITCTTSLETILPRLPERSMSQPFM